MKKTIYVALMTLCSLFCCCAVQAQAVAAAEKMNAIYVGVDNPIKVAVAGYKLEEIQVSVSRGKITGSLGKYIWSIESPPGDVKLYVSVLKKNVPTLVDSIPFRAKRIPDPVARLNNADIRQAKGVVALLDNFDFDARCEIMAYEVTITAKYGDPVTTKNRGGSFTPPVQTLVNKAKTGDRLTFDGIQCRCPGDKTGRQLTGISIVVK